MAHGRQSHIPGRPARSRSPGRKHGGHHSHSHRNRDSLTFDKPLPFGARLLDRHDLKAYRSIFESYLDIQKQIDVAQISEGELKGRWKSFIKKWNHGELAEGWYDPTRLQQTPQDVVSQSIALESQDEQQFLAPELSDDDDYGPAPAFPKSNSARAGPAIPSTNDLALRKEAERENHESAMAQARAIRRADAKLEKQRLEDLVPRAEPGTRERQIEKKREAAASNKAFAESKGGAAGSGMVEIGESDLMGGGYDDSLEGIRRRKKEQERKLSERELRREEYARARREEVEQRRKDFAEKEEERTKRFIELAKRRFG